MEPELSTEISIFMLMFYEDSANFVLSGASVLKLMEPEVATKTSIFMLMHRDSSVNLVLSWASILKRVEPEVATGASVFMQITRQNLYLVKNLLTFEEFQKPVGGLVIVSMCTFSL
jgi:hypothetical protein